MSLRVGGLLEAQIASMGSLLPLVLVAGMAVLLPLFILGIIRLRRAPNRKVLAAVIAMGVALSALSIAYGYGLHEAYVSSQTWTFSYYVHVRTNSTGPDAIVVPSVVDEALLAGLSVKSGTANWSFVDTEHGRGIYIGFTGAATLSASVSRYPAPEPVPYIPPTMTNGSAWPPDLWIYYPGTAGVYLVLDAWLSCVGYVRSGWNLFPTLPPAVPTA